MTVRAVAGLLVLHTVFAAVGASVLLACAGASGSRRRCRSSGSHISWRRGARRRLDVPPRARDDRTVSSGSPPSATGIGVVAVGAYLASLFRIARVEGVFSSDGWAFWVTRGKAVYYFDGLDEQVFATVPHPSYPPVIPILDAAAFHAMGSADSVTLHVHYWLLAVGFVATVAGLLAARVPAWILWPSLALALVLPRMRSHARLTKREGLVLAACVLVAAVLASLRTRRRDWRPLLLVGLGAAAATIPRRLWHAAHGIEGETGTGGLDTLVSERTVDSLRLALDVLVSDRFSLVPTVGLAAVALAAVWGRRRHALYVASLVGS